MLRPHKCIVPFEATGLPLHKKRADYYVPAIVKGYQSGYFVDASLESHT